MITIQEQIKLLQAVADGKTLQLQFIDTHGSMDWMDASPDWHSRIKQGAISIDVERYNWRVKPEPRTKWLNECSDGAAAAYASERKAREAADYGSTHYSYTYLRIAVKYQEVL